MKDDIILHMDFDYFYAQCEEIKNPLLKTRPIVVCAFSNRGNDSGAVATANYTSRKYGVKSGMPIVFAKRRLSERKDAVFLPTDFDYYSQITEKAMEIMKKDADVFEYVGRDEAYIKVTNRVEDFSKASHFAQQLKNKIRDIVRLTCSIGISPNKLVSKIASDYHKPDGLTIVKPNQVLEFLEPLKIQDVPGIGSHTTRILYDMGVKTIGQTRQFDIFTLQQKFGRKLGTYIFNSVRGISTSSVTLKSPNIQFSKIHTLETDSLDYKFLSKQLEKTCQEVHKIIMDKNKMFRSIGVQFIQSDLISKSRSFTLKNSISNLSKLQDVAVQLLKETLDTQTIPFRRIGVRVSELSDIKGQSSISNYF